MNRKNHLRFVPTGTAEAGLATVFQRRLPAVLLTAVGLFAAGSASADAPTVTVEPFLEGLEMPWDMAFLSDGTMFFTEKCKGLSVRLPTGEIKHLLGVADSSGYAVVADDLFCDGQAGVQGIAVDPEFAANRFVYVYSSAKGEGRTYDGFNNIVMRFKVDDAFASISDRTEIIADIGYKAKPTNHPFGGSGAHNGGRLRFSPADGFLYVTTGDNHNGERPQHPTQLGGKVLRVDRDGKAAADNKPPAGFDPRIFTYGHRNPQGISFRPVSNEPYTSEHGPWHNDEVTRLVNGGNAGWDPRPGIAGREDCPDGYCGYSPNQMGAMDPKERSAFMPMTDSKTYPDVMKPAWNNNGLSQGLFGSTWLVGPQWKDWNGRLALGFGGIGIHGTPVGNRIELLDVAADGQSARAETLPWPTFAGRFRSLVQGPDGKLYVADEGNNVIWRVTPN